MSQNYFYQEERNMALETIQNEKKSEIILTCGSCPHGLNPGPGGCGPFISSDGKCPRDTKKDPTPWIGEENLWQDTAEQKP